MYAKLGVDHVIRVESLLQEGKIYELIKFVVTPPKTAFKPF